jgi:hypothetical protein
MMIKTLTDWNSTTKLLGTNTLKEGAGVALGE